MSDIGMNQILDNANRTKQPKLAGGVRHESLNKSIQGYEYIHTFAAVRDIKGVPP